MATILNKRDKAVDFNPKRHEVAFRVFDGKRVSPLVQSDGKNAALRVIGLKDAAEWVRNGASRLNAKAGADAVE